MKTKIVYVTGNVLDAPQPIIVHQVNCQGVMGSGVAKAIREKYPEVFEAYETFLIDGYELGSAQFVETHDGKEIVNLFSQEYYLPRTKRHTSYDALVTGFEFIKKWSKEDIAMPRIGCGLGGGDWHIVSAIIESVFDDRQIFVYDLE